MVFASAFELSVREPRQKTVETEDIDGAMLKGDRQISRAPDYHLLAISKTHKTPPLACSAPLVGDV